MNHDICINIQKVSFIERADSIKKVLFPNFHFSKMLTVEHSVAGRITK